MRILVLNGSPKGKYSITVHTCLYLESLHPEHQFTYLNVGQTIKSLEKDFSPAEKALTEAELILFSYPVYTFIAPYQLHRFMELLKELHREGTTIIMVTHSQRDANYADRIINLFDGEIVSEVEM
jgi:ABC-type lipoprotein export system ATPase subunit